MALALRPLLSDSSMKSRWGSQTLAVALWLAVESGDTSLAGFDPEGEDSCAADTGAAAVAAAVAETAKSPPKSGDTSLAVLALAGVCPSLPEVGRQCRQL
jgi:hypothetical protein